VARRVCAIIPAHNEGDVIAETILAAQGIPEVDQIVVVDDGSTDDTSSAARAAGAGQVVRLDRNLGKGGALNRALEEANCEVLLLLDADLGSSAHEASKLLSPVLDGEADMTVAIFQSKRAQTDDASSGLAAKSKGFGMVMKTARMGIWLMTRRWVVSPLAGPRALKREIIDKAGGFAPKFGVEVGLTIDALRMGYRVVEVPVHMVHRPSGRDLKGFMHRGGQMVDMLRTLGRKALRI
jgi:glycosyltransferase involved in cell wall biosynthesis